jgi:hypothetical protein
LGIHLRGLGWELSDGLLGSVRRGGRGLRSVGRLGFSGFRDATDGTDELSRERRDQRDTGNSQATQEKVPFPRSQRERLESLTLCHMNQGLVLVLLLRGRRGDIIEVLRQLDRRVHTSGAVAHDETDERSRDQREETSGPLDTRARVDTRLASGHSLQGLAHHAIRGCFQEILPPHGFGRFLGATSDGAEARSDRARADRQDIDLFVLKFQTERLREGKDIRLRSGIDGKVRDRQSRG